MRQLIASDLVKMAKRLVFDEEIVFVRDADTEDRIMNEIWRDIGIYLDRVRKNEDVKTSTARTDNGSAMEISIAVEQHEEKEAILKAVIKHAERIGRRHKVKVIASLED
jgi:hypothetical protein